MIPSVPRSRLVRAALVFVVALAAFDRALYWGIGELQARVMRGVELPHMLAAVEGKAGYQWLVLGTSRTYEAIHPTAIERAFGLKAFKSAGRGKGPRYQYEFYRLYAPMFGAPRVLLLGSERQGLSAEQVEVCEVLLRLPMKGSASSLNLAVAAGVLLYAML